MLDDPFPAATFTDVGKAEESGSERFFRDRAAPLTDVQGNNEDGKMELPWKALF